jgi:hypothetical protein
VSDFRDLIHDRIRDAALDAGLAPDCLDYSISHGPTGWAADVHDVVEGGLTLRQADDLAHAYAPPGEIVADPVTVTAYAHVRGQRVRLVIRHTGGDA